MTNLELDYHHAGVSVPDLERAIGWYEAVLGFSVESRFRIQQANAEVAVVRNGSLRFELFEVCGALPLPEERRSPPEDLKTHGNKHVAFRIADLERFLRLMRQRNADVAMIVREDFGRGCFIRDCAGNLIEFVEVN